MQTPEGPSLGQVIYDLTHLDQWRERVTGEIREALAADLREHRRPE